jgi:hypothetical protein
MLSISSVPLRALLILPLSSLKVGLIFRPSWARIHVIISEVNSALSTKTAYAYAEAVLSHIRPSR